MEPTIDNVLREIEVDRLAKLIECRGCDEYATGALAPTHSGSTMCESGSIASGGKNAHCTCDVCF